MDAESKKEVELEIAHVLFLDIVGYSKLSVNEQHVRVDELNGIVRLSEQFQKAEAANRILKIPTGDGMALVFYKSPEEPAQCAFEISRALKEHPRLQIRMGIHSGPVSRVVDVNERTNVAGAGINMAKRVMDCGDAGHILLSKHVAEDLEHYERWRPFLHDIDIFEVKHGVRVSVTNLYSDEVGNPRLPSKLRAVKKRPTHSVSAIVDNSIAVLPFENLSEEKQNEYFAGGVQDEILTNLARIADLKVISRTSVMQYKSGIARNLRELGQQLGVAHVVEGSVQRSGNRVRVNAQLVDARTDRHLWAQTYDRDLVDVFAIQSEVAEQIVSQLKTSLSAEEKAAIEQKPTADLAAYDLYIRAKILIQSSSLSTPQEESLREAVRVLDQAIERDPAFALAYYQLAYVHDLIYFVGTDHTPAQLAMADAAIQTLTRLRPNSGEAHLALATHLYFGYLDYDRARQEINLAQKSLPNDPLPFELAGFIDRRQGRWTESTKNLERTIELDPQSPFLLQQVARSYLCLRRYADAEEAYERAIKLTPKDAATRASRAEVELNWHADARPLISTIQAILAQDSREATNIAEYWLLVSQCERDLERAQQALAALPI